jgi:hypothetical protein
MNSWLQYGGIAAGAVLILALVIAVSAAISNAEDRAKMEATLKQQSEIIAKQNELIKGFDERMRLREEETQKRIEDLQAVARRAQTPAQIIREIPTYVPPAAQPKLEEAAGQPPRLVFEGEEKIKAYFEGVLAAKKTELELAHAQGDVADLKAMVAAKDEQIAAIEKQRDAAVTAAKGGTKWQRFKRATKWLGTGIVIGMTAGFVLAK